PYLGYKAFEAMGWVPYFKQRFGGNHAAPVLLAVAFFLATWMFDFFPLYAWAWHILVIRIFIALVSERAFELRIIDMFRGRAPPAPPATPAPAPAERQGRLAWFFGGLVSGAARIVYGILTGS